MVNSVCLTGRFRDDPEVKRVGPKSTAMCRFIVACETRYLQGSEWKSEMNFPPCIAWGRIAEHIGNNGRKGMSVSLGGRFKTGSYEKDGKKYYTNEVLVTELDIFQPPNKEAPPQGPPGTPDSEVPF